MRKEQITDRQTWQDSAKNGKLPAGMPTNPAQAYKEDWKGWKKFFAQPRYLGYSEAHALVHKLRAQEISDMAADILGMSKESLADLMLSRREGVIDGKTKDDVLEAAKKMDTTYQQILFSVLEDDPANKSMTRDKIESLHTREMRITKDRPVWQYNQLSFRNPEDWVTWTKNRNMKEIQVPTNPNKYYRNYGWTDWRSWLNSPVDDHITGQDPIL